MTHDNETAQVAAEKLPGELTPEKSGEYSFKNINLLTHPMITAPELTPANRGESVDVDIGIGVSLGVHNEGAKLGGVSVSERVVVGVERVKAGLDAELSGSGSVRVLESG